MDRYGPTGTLDSMLSGDRSAHREMALIRRSMTLLKCIYRLNYPLQNLAWMLYAKYGLSLTAHVAGRYMLNQE